MGDIQTSADQVYRDFTTDGVASSGLREPTKADIRGLFRTVDLAVYAAQAGITIVADLAARDAFFAITANRTKLCYVNNNAGSASNAANGVYEYVGGAARIATGFYQGVASVVQPLVDLAEAWAESEGEEPGGAGTKSAKEWAETVPIESNKLAVLGRKQRLAASNPVYAGVAMIPSDGNWDVRLPVQGSTRFDDYQEYAMFDQAEALGCDYAWSFNGRRARVRGVEINAEEFALETMTSGGATDTGLPPSTAESAWALGEVGQAVNGTNFQLAGLGHDYLDYRGCAILRDSDATNYCLPENAGRGLILPFNTLTFNQDYVMKTASGKIACRYSVAYIFDAINRRLRLSQVLDFGHAEVNCTPAVWYAYVAMNAGRLHTVAKAIGLNPVDCSFRDGRQIGNAGNGAQTIGSYGQITRFASYHPDHADVLFEVLLAYGVPMRVDGVDDAWTQCNNGTTFTLCQDYGPKHYFHGVSNASTAWNVSGKVITLLTDYQVRVGSPL